MVEFGGGWNWLIGVFKHYINFINLENVKKRKIPKIKMNSFLAAVKIHRKYKNTKIQNSFLACCLN